MLGPEHGSDFAKYVRDVLGSSCQMRHLGPLITEVPPDPHPDAALCHAAPSSTQSRNCDKACMQTIATNEACW